MASSIVSRSGERHVASGCIDVAGHDMVVRLQRIYAAVSALVGEHRPDMIAIERVFLHRNPDSALKLGQARGVALCAAASLGARVHEYAPRAIKMAVTGYGAAAKPQVAQMVCTLLQLEVGAGGRCRRCAGGGALPRADAPARGARAAMSPSGGRPAMIGSLSGVLASSRRRICCWRSAASATKSKRRCRPSTPCRRSASPRGC